MYCCVKDIDRCPYKRQVTTINQTRDQCMQFCMSQPEFQNDWKRDMYSSACGKFCQALVDQKIKQYGYGPCEKKIQPAVHWYQTPIVDQGQNFFRPCCQ